MQDCLKLKENCRFYPYDGGHNKEEFIICSPANRQFRISTLVKEILQQLDGKTSVEEIASGLNNRSVSISADQLRHMLGTQYAEMGIFENPDTPENPNNHVQLSKKTGFPFLLSWELIPQQLVSLISVHLTFLFKLFAFLPGLLLIIVTHYFVYFNHSDSSLQSNTNFLAVLGLCLLSILCHEFGHAAAVSRYGGTPGKIGFALYLLMPSFFADVSEIWRFRRKHRMVVDLGGVYFQQLAFAVFALLGLWTSSPAYFVACHLIDVMILLTLNPVFRFDGYWFLVDFLGVPNLYQLALTYIKHSIKKLFGSDTPHQLPPMRRHIHLCFLLYALVCNLFLVIVIWFSCRYLYVVFVRLPDLFPQIFNSMIFAFQTHDLTLFLNRLLTLFFVIAFPGTALMGLGIYIFKLARYSVMKLQSITQQR